MERFRGMNAQKAQTKPGKAPDLPWPVRVYEGTTRVDQEPRFYRLAAVDQAPFITEEGERRRHVILLSLIAPEGNETFVQDHNQLIQGLVLGTRAGRRSRQDEW